MNYSEKACPVCGAEAKIIDDFDRIQIDCKNCGRFRIAAEVMQDEFKDGKFKPKIKTCMRDYLKQVKGEGKSQCH